MRAPLSVNTLNELVRLSLQNTERFIKDAKLLIDDGSYGHALALTVLADEELVKTSIYHIGSLGLIEIYSKDKYVYIGKKKINIKSHRLKHSFQAVMYLAIWVLDPLFEELFKAKESFEDGREKETVIEIINRHAERLLRSTEEDTPEEKEVKKHMDRFKMLEKIKQSALYVDIKKGTPISPKSITQNMVIDYFSEVNKRIKRKKNDINLPVTKEFKDLLYQIKPIFDKITKE